MILSQALHSILTYIISRKGGSGHFMGCTGQALVMQVSHNHPSSFSHEHTRLPLHNSRLSKTRNFKKEQSLLLEKSLFSALSFHSPAMESQVTSISS